MKKELVITCFICLDIILILYTIKANKKKNYISREVTGILGIAAAAVLFYCFAVAAADYFWVSFLFSLNFICFNGIVYYLYLFSLKYTNSKFLKQTTKNILKIILGCDAVSIFLNPFFSHSVTFWIRNARDGIYSIETMKLPYAVHLILCYILFAASVFHLIVKAADSAYIYKIKYNLLSLVLITAAFLNAEFIFTNLSIDFSVLIYAAAAIIIYNFTFTYVPQKVRLRMFDSILQESADGVILFDAEGKCIYVNSRASELFEHEEKIEDRLSFCKSWNLFLDEKGNDMLEKEMKIPFKNEILSLVAALKIMYDKNGKVTGSFCWMQDVTKEEKLSKYDALTGIYNRTYFFYQVEQLLHKKSEQMVMVAMNIERFKLINDMFGFETGNLLLKEVAQAFRTINIKDYIFGRMDSDRFAVCMPKDYPLEEFLKVCKADSIKIQLSIPIVINVGVYEIDEISIPAEVMYDRAMLALNKIKGKYQNNVGYYDENLRNHLLEEQAILNDMEQAILEKQFEVYLQPQMNHANNCIVGTEALVRWKHPAKGMISPAEFIPLFEENGFITKLDQYVWESVCQIIQRLRKKGKANTSISVNISMKDFYYIDIYQAFIDLIKKYNIPPESLKLEITESAFVLDVEKQVELVKKLQKAGFTIEMDDFGSGYSSLNTLKDIPVDVLKMDMKFLSKGQDVERSRNILEMVVALSKSLGMKVIAEGVETKKQADYLSKIGCENIQGYYYAKPMAQKEFEEYLEKFDFQDIMMNKERVHG